MNKKLKTQVTELLKLAQTAKPEVREAFMGAVVGLVDTGSAMRSAASASFNGEEWVGRMKLMLVLGQK